MVGLSAAGSCCRFPARPERKLPGGGRTGDTSRRWDPPRGSRSRRTEPTTDRELSRGQRGLVAAGALCPRRPPHRGRRPDLALQTRLVPHVERRDRLGIDLDPARPRAVERGCQRRRQHVGLLPVAARLVPRGPRTVGGLGAAHLGCRLRGDGPVSLRPAAALLGYRDRRHRDRSRHHQPDGDLQSPGGEGLRARAPPRRRGGVAAQPRSREGLASSPCRLGRRLGARLLLPASVTAVRRRPVRLPGHLAPQSPPGARRCDRRRWWRRSWSCLSP